MHLEIAAHITTIHVGMNTRLQHSAIQRSVEYALINIGATLNLNSCQSVVPLLKCLLAYLIEVLVSDLGIEVSLCALCIHIRDTHLELNLLTLAGIELAKNTDVLTLQLLLASNDGRLGNLCKILGCNHIVIFSSPSVGNIGTPKAPLINRTTQLGIEIESVGNLAIAIAPATCLWGATHPTAEGSVAFNLYILLLRATTHSSCQINLHTRKVALGIGETQYTTMRRSRTLGINIIIGKAYTIPTCLGFFRGLVIARTPALYRAILSSRNGMQLTCCWHNQKITHIAIPTHTTHLRHRKTLNGGMLRAVTRGIISASNGIGAYLCHSEWSGSTWIGLAKSVIYACSIHTCTCTNKRIHPLRSTILPLVARYRQQSQSQNIKHSLHTLFLHYKYYHYSGIITLPHLLKYAPPDTHPLGASIWAKH